jgi:hypothetical protein
MPHGWPVCSPEPLLPLSPRSIRALLTAFGAPASLKPTPSALTRAAFERRLPPKLARALLFIARFATDSGRRAFVEAARAVGDPRAASWLLMPPADVAALIAIERATAKGRPRRVATRIAALALLRVERELPERPTYELLAPTPVAHASVRPALARLLGDALVDVWTHADDDGDGAFHVALFRRAPVVSRLAVDSGRVTARHDADVVVDLVRVFPGATRVALTLATPELLPDYARALGLSLRPSLTLKPLHEMTPEVLARAPLPDGVKSMKVVATRRRTADGARRELRALDALDPAHAADGSRAGYVDRATLRVDAGARAADGFLQLPHRVEIADRALEPAVRGAFAAVGLFEPGALPDDARSLALSPHGEWRWRGVLGDDAFERLLALGRFARARVAHVATEEHRMHGASYVVRAVPGEPGVEYALAEDRAYGARLVGKDERAAWRLDLAALAAAMRADLGAARVDGPAAIADAGVLDLGVVTVKSGRLRFVYAMAPGHGWIEAVRRACGVGVTPVVLVPRGHASEVKGMLCEELDLEEQLGARRIGRVLGRAAQALGIGDEVEGWRTCAEDIVIDAAAEKVWVLGALVALSDKPYRALLVLARRAGVVTSKELGLAVSASEYPDGAARRIKGQLEAQVDASLTKAGVTWDRARFILTEGKKGYRLGMSARVVGEAPGGAARAAAK